MTLNSNLKFEAINTQKKKQKYILVCDFTGNQLIINKHIMNKMDRKTRDMVQQC